MKYEQAEAIYRRLEASRGEALQPYRAAPGRVGQSRSWKQALSRRQFLRISGAAVLGTALGSHLWPSHLVAAHGTHEPVPIPGGTPVLGGGYHVFGPGFPGLDPVDAEPSSITDFNGFLGIAFISGTVTRTNTQTGEVRTLPFVNNDMRFMKGVFRGTDGEIHQGAFGFV
jgi:hypothetical protein